MISRWSEWSGCLENGICQKTKTERRVRETCVDSNGNYAPLFKCNDMGDSLEERSCTCSDKTTNRDYVTTKSTTEVPETPESSTTTEPSTTPAPSSKCTSEIYWSCKAKAYPDCWFCCWWIWFLVVILVLVRLKSFHLKFNDKSKLLLVLLICCCCRKDACCRKDPDENNILSFDKIRRGTMIPDERNTFGGMLSFLSS